MACDRSQAIVLARRAGLGADADDAHTDPLA